MLSLYSVRVIVRSDLETDSNDKTEKGQERQISISRQSTKKKKKAKDIAPMAVI